MSRPPIAAVTLTTDNLRVRITIPAAGGKLIDLIMRAVDAPREPLAIKILGRLPDFTERGRFIVADPRPGAAIQAADYTTHGEAVEVGEDYTNPSAGDLDSYLKATDGSDITAVAILFW
jgi:hypothetical protein